MAAVLTEQNRREVLESRDAHDPRGEATLAESLRLLGTGMDCLSVDDMDTAVIIPWPFNHLMARGKWLWISMPIASRWPKVCSAMPVVRLWRRFELTDCEPESIIDDGGNHDVENADLLQPRMFQDLADFLRDRSHIITREAPVPDDEKARIEMYVKWLERCVTGCSPEAVQSSMVETNQGRGGRYFTQLGKRVHYFSEFFIKVICFTMDIRNDNYHSDSYVGRVFRRAIRLLPPQVQNLLDEMYTDQFFPSPSTISRANLFLDVAFMRMMAQHHADLIGAKAIFFGLSDASPQGGNLYQISEYYCFGGVDSGILVEAGLATLQLKSFPKKPEEIAGDHLAVMAKLMDIIRSAKSLHVFPPTCMDSKNSGASVRGHCFVHQVRLESLSWQHAADMMALFFSFTLDSGPERGLRHVHLPTLDTLPHWRPLQLEHEDDMDALLNPPPVDPLISLTQIIDVAGVFHIVDNIEKRMLGHIMSYQEHQKEFESLVTIYHRPYLRKRFRNNCLLGVSEEDKGMFNVSVPNLEGGRVWTVVTKLATYLGEREQLIRHNWDADK